MDPGAASALKSELSPSARFELLGDVKDALGRFDSTADGSFDNILQSSARSTIAFRFLGRSALMIRSTKAAGKRSLGVTFTS